MIPRSIHADHPVDPIVIDILRNVAEEARAESIAYMLVGATARDILLTHVFGLATRPIRYFENAEQRVASRLRLLQSALTQR